MDETGYRTFSIRAGEEEGAPVRGILTSEQPVEMFDFQRGQYVPEILLASGMKTRAGSERIKLLDTHGKDSVRQVLGSFKNLQTHDAGTRGVPYRFIDGEIEISAAEKEIATKLSENHINEMSVGYAYSQEKTVHVPAGETREIDGREIAGGESGVNVRTEWQAQEASLVPLGADDQAQVRGYKDLADAKAKISSKNERSVSDAAGVTPAEVVGNDTPEASADFVQAAKNKQQQQTQQPIKKMEDNSIDKAAVEAKIADGIKAGEEARDKRVNAIKEAIREAGINDAQWALEQVSTAPAIEDVQRGIIAKLKEQNAEVGNKLETAGEVGMSKKELGSYSISKAMLALAEGRQLDGLEGEVSKHISQRCNRRPDGFFVAPEALKSQRAATLAGSIASAGTGGGVVEDSVLADGFIDVLRPKMASAEAGITILSGLTGNAILPKKTTAASATWAGDEATTGHDEGAVVIGSISLEPQHLGCYTEVSKQLLHQGTPDVDSLIRDDLTTAVAVALDSSVFNGSGTGQPNGIANGSGVGTEAIGTDGQPDATDIFNFVSAVDTANALDGNLAWVTTPAVAAHMKKTPLFSSTDSPIWDWRGGNSIVGYDAYSSSNLADHQIVFGSWSDYVMAVFDGIDLVAVQDTTGAKKRLITYVVNLMADGDVRRGGSFCVNS